MPADLTQTAPEILYRMPRVSTPRDVPALSRRVLADDVFEALTGLVMDHVVAPGERMSIDGLAARLGVSPTPVSNDAFYRHFALKGHRWSPPSSTTAPSGCAATSTTMAEGSRPGGPGPQLGRTRPLPDRQLQRRDRGQRRHRERQSADAHEAVRLLRTGGRHRGRFVGPDGSRSVGSSASWPSGRRCRA